jgi:hypothetical protein
MSVQADTKYEAVVSSVLYTQNDNGTKGIFISYKTGDGMIDRTWYVTENTIDRLKENLKECFGITDEQFDDKAFLRDSLCSFITGQNCSITTELQKDSNKNIYKDAKGNTYVGVQWMNPSRAGKKITEDGFDKMAALFGATSKSQDGPQDPPPSDWGGEGPAF